ncbi:biotin/lipoyl-containing protein [Rheinheimera nanhaiensis]|uniref:Lipoyl-binding domain-containing protein n=1 Tax=Rheinheimera nanhaiensis E407-8 TaxID=562729 RepID=I1DWK9_9GAMM|nr:biotin/lipoyl-containing protein [Rheinheimera nanhaiensis]GAB58437.1 hypothetical protein RNAN_1409 [Rheinheimera nanhaiensis E407-8]
MIKLIKAPFLGVNDKSARLLRWHIEAGARVESAEVLCQLETTKTLFEVEADSAGYFYTEIAADTDVAVDQVLAIVSDTELTDYHTAWLQAITEPQTGLSAGNTARYTKKAAMLAQRHNVDIDALANRLGKKVQEQDVLSVLAHQTSEPRRMGFLPQERIGIIGGVSGGGAMIIIDAILRQPQQQAVAVFDQNPAFIGQSILGVPVVGAADDLLEQYLHDGIIDKVVIGFNRDLAQRAELFNQLQAKGIPFANVIDPSAELRNHVILGVGNIILANVYIGPCTEIGNNNFLTAGIHIEHGNKVGSHCAFGPAVATSGNVVVGNGVRFAAGIVVEPDVCIGDNCVISSGAVIVGNVAADSVVKINYSQQIKAR